jgi:hypothetical protein
MRAGVWGKKWRFATRGAGNFLKKINCHLDGKEEKGICSCDQELVDTPDNVGGSLKPGSREQA